MTWFAKPDQINPLECARYGWNNREVDMLQCQTCKAMISFNLPLLVQNDKATGNLCHQSAIYIFSRKTGGGIQIDLE
jgi:hypothetical protein